MFCYAHAFCKEQRCATLGINPSCHPLRFRLCPFDKWAFLQAGYVPFFFAQTEPLMVLLYRPQLRISTVGQIISGVRRI